MDSIPSFITKVIATRAAVEVPVETPNTLLNEVIKGFFAILVAALTHWIADRFGSKKKEEKENADPKK